MKIHVVGQSSVDLYFTVLYCTVSWLFRSGKFNFSQGNLEKMRKVREFQNFPKRFIVYRLLKSMISINCKQFMVRNIIFIIVIVITMFLDRLVHANSVNQDQTAPSSLHHFPFFLHPLMVKSHCSNFRIITAFVRLSSIFYFYWMNQIMIKPVYAICKQQRRTSACLDSIISLVSISEISSL